MSSNHQEDNNNTGNPLPVVSGDSPREIPAEGSTLAENSNNWRSMPVQSPPSMHSSTTEKGKGREVTTPIPGHMSIHRAIPHVSDLSMVMQSGGHIFHPGHSRAYATAEQSFDSSDIKLRTVGWGTRSPHPNSRASVESTRRRKTTIQELQSMVNDMRFAVHKDFGIISNKFATELAKVLTAHERWFVTIVSYLDGVKATLPENAEIPLSPLNKQVSTDLILEESEIGNTVTNEPSSQRLVPKDRVY